MQNADHSSYKATKNYRFMTGSAMNLRRQVRRLKAAGIWCKCSHGSLWVHEADAHAANVLFGWAR